MLPLNDMLIAQNSQAMQALAQQFNLTQQQAQAAVEALLPAFSQGLKHNASDPYGVGAFLSALSTGQHARYFDNPAAAFAPDGQAEGNGILGHIFGSKELSRTVAQQASAATGIGQDVIRQMLPAIAAMIMGGLFKQGTGQFGAGTGQPAGFGTGGSGSGSNPFGDILAEMMRQGTAMTGGRPSRQPPAPDPMDNPFGKILQDMFGGSGVQQPTRSPGARETGAAYGDNPLGRIFEQMLGGGRAPEPEPEPEPERRENPSGRARNPYDDLFGNMFETGAKQRDDYQKNMESVVDQFLKGMERRR